MEKSEKIKRIEAIESEVDEFHPLLERLFPKLPYIKNVEYTHGPSERGADFLLEKIDPTLDEIGYVGIIAKKGKIKSDLSDIEKQIDECTEKRFFSSGKKKVNINEIWVCSTAGVSERAKERIHHKFRSLKIAFIPGAKIADLVDENVNDFWSDIDVEIGAYLTVIRNDMNQRNSQTSLVLVNGEPFYIKLTIHEKVTDGYKSKRTRRKKKVESTPIDEITKNKISVIEAEMGAGKSKLIRQMILDCANPSAFLQHGIIPIYCGWREFCNQFCADLVTLVCNRLGESGKIANKSEVSKIAIFIDGLDEAHLNGLENDEAESLSDLLADIARQADDEALYSVIFSTRPISEVSNLSEKSSWPLYGLEPLTINKIIEFVNVVCDSVNIPKNVVQDIKKSQLFKNLPQTPIAAILFSKLIADNPRDQQELPANLTELYSQSLEQMLGRWEISKGLTTQREYEACQEISFRLSEFCIKNDIYAFSVKGALDMIYSYLRERQMDLDGKKIFDYLVNRTGVFSVDSNRGVFFFKHRSFSEFLYAKRARFNAGLDIDEKAFHVYWRNIYFFYLGLLKDCPETLQRLMDLELNSEEQKWLKFLNMPSYFLAAFSTPYSIVENSFPKLLINIAEIYNGIISGRSRSRLNELPEMQLLWLFQLLVRDLYSYEYFRRASQAANDEIDRADCDESVKAVALFFNALIAGDLNVDKPFDYLSVWKEISGVPVSVSYALLLETDALKSSQRSALLKRRNKKLKQIVKNNQSLRSKLKTLFESPAKLTFSE